MHKQLLCQSRLRPVLAPERQMSDSSVGFGRSDGRQQPVRAPLLLTLIIESWFSACCGLRSPSAGEFIRL